jgi:hypothetical protein
MKTNPVLFFVFIVACAIACHKDEPDPEKVKGTLALNVGLFISVNEVENNLKSTSAVEDFKVTIFNSSGTEVMNFERAADIPPEIPLDPGQYYVTAHSNNNLPAAFSNPYYFGESAVFTITSSQQQSVTVNCELANVMVSIIYSDQVKSSFTDFSTVVTTTAGSLTYIKDEIRIGYFQPLAMNINVSLTSSNGDGTFDVKTLTGNIPDPKPRRHYEIHVNALVDGTAAFLINVTEGPDSVQIVNVNEGGTSLPGKIDAGDLLITEIMYDPAALTDAEGEWFEIYNNTENPIDLDQLVIRRNDTEHHVVSGTFMLGAHEYRTFAHSETTLAGDKYIYGSSLSLTNSGATLSLYNYGSDGTDGALIFAVNYGTAGFPDATGASISLSPVLLNAADAVIGTSWCISRSSYSTGDLGTPGIINDACL